MPKQKLRRWSCPDCGNGVLAPTRPRKNDVRRYCLPCSERTGRLVERTSPSVLKDRERKAALAKEKRDKKKAVAEAYYIVRCKDAAGVEYEVHCRDELKRMARRAWGRKSRLAQSPPSLIVRRKTEMAYHWGTSGRARSWKNEIVISIPPNVTWEDLQVLLLHELCHLKAPWGEGHGHVYRQIFAAAAGKVWPKIGRMPWRPPARRQYDLAVDRLCARSKRLAEG